MQWVCHHSSGAAHLAALERRVEGAEDVLGDAEHLVRLLDPAPREVEDAVEDVGVTVVHAHVERLAERTLDQRRKRELGQRRKLGGRGQRLRELVLRKADDRDPILATRPV
jgi:hypothetical protein